MRSFFAEKQFASFVHPIFPAIYSINNNHRNGVALNVPTWCDLNITLLVRVNSTPERCVSNMHNTHLSKFLISHHGHCFLDDFCFLFGHHRAEASVQCSAADSFTHLWFNKQPDFSFAVSIPFNPIQLLHIPYSSPFRAVVFLFHFTAFQICIVRWTVGDAFTGKHKHTARMNEAYSVHTMHGDALIKE